MGKIALITGITGQDGSYLAEFLIKKNYKIIGTFSTKKPNLNKINKLNLKKKIIFIDDSSTDGTYKEICRFKKYKFVRGYSRNNKMRDLSKSVLYGVRKTKKNYVLVMDCDLQHNPSYIKSMWSKIINTNCDIVKGKCEK